MIVLGSTGSIGVNALKIAKQFNIEIEALVCGSNIKLLNKQIKETNPKCIGISNPNDKKYIESNNAKIFVGSDEICQMIKECRSKLTLNAVIGYAGLPFSMAALDSNKNIILANKESLVIAGALIKHKIKETDSNILHRIFPIDSEHFSLWNLLAERYIKENNIFCYENNFDKKMDFSNIYITASGGALRDMPLENIESARLKEVLKHPTWNMGQKITIDSATLINKLYEVLEAHWLFSTTRIDAMIERGSLIHALVEYSSGEIVALASHADMCLPIAYGMDYKQAKGGFSIEKLGLSNFTKIHFQEIDINRYPLWRYKDLLLEKPSLGIALNASNEMVQNLFLQEKIPFGAFAFIISKVLEHFWKEKCEISSILDIENYRNCVANFVSFLLKTHYNDVKIC